jgi:hypothetical protein
MLCQLVCTDRRYARMNCFNIRELQGILKRRFFTDLINSHDHKTILSSAMMGAKYKLNNAENVNLDITLFYKWGVLDTQNYKISNFGSSHLSFNKAYASPLDFICVEFLNSLNFSFFFFYNYALNVINYFSLLNFNLHIGTFCSFIYGSLIHFLSNIFSSVFLNCSVLVSNFLSFNFKSFSFFNYFPFTKLTYFTDDLSDINEVNNFSFLERSSSQRLNRFYTPLIGYDYKSGHYLGSSENLYPQLMLSFIEVTRSVKKPA